MKVKLPNVKGPIKLQVFGKQFATFDENGIAEVDDTLGKILLTKQAAHGYTEVKENKVIKEVKEVKVKEDFKKIPKESSPPEGVKTFLDEVKG